MNCLHCDEPVADTDDYLLTPVIRAVGSVTIERGHRECLFREVYGGIGHHEDHEFWCLTMHDPDGGRTRRQSALEVWEHYRQSQDAPYT